MAELYGQFRYVVPAAGSFQQPQQQQQPSCIPQMASLVQCPNCTFRFPVPYTPAPQFLYSPGVPHNFYAHGAGVQYTQPFPQQPFFQVTAQPGFFCTPSPGHQPFGIGQQQQQQQQQQQPTPQQQHHLEVTNNTSVWRYVSQSAENGTDLTVHRIRDILIDILNSDNCRYGVTVSHLLNLLKNSCAINDITLPTAVIDEFKEFLQHRMADYVEVQDDLYRYRRPRLSIRETDVSNQPCERSVSRSKTPPVAWANEEKTLQKYASVPNVARDENSEINSVKELRVNTAEEKIRESVQCGSVAEPWESSNNECEVDENAGKEHLNETEQKPISDDVDKTVVAESMVSIIDECNGPFLKNTQNTASSVKLYTEEDVARSMKKWKEIFTGDVKELIRYLRMVDGYFECNGGKVTYSEFEALFGVALNKRWESCEIDLVEMGIIVIVEGIGVGEEPVLSVNPIVKEVKFMEVTELAQKAYELLSRMLKSVDSVKIEVVVRALDFGENSNKTVDEKYTLLWEALSDYQFKDLFLVDVLQKQNKERGFDVMVRLNPNLECQEIFGQ